MQIVMRKISELKFAEYNPRQISESQFEKLKLSITTFGFVEPVVVNKYPGREDIIVGGHMRVRAALDLKHEEVPTYEVSLDEKQEKLLNLALNRIHGEWNQEKLAELVVRLSQEGADMALSGMEQEDLRLIIDEQVPLNMPSMDDEGVKMKSITVYYPADVMDEVLKKINQCEGKNISEKFLNFVNSHEAPKVQD